MRSLAFLQEMRERHGDLFPVRLLNGQPLLVAGNPDLARQVFKAPPDVLRAGEGNRRVLSWLFGEHSLIMLDGERHLSHRRLLLPAFHGRRLEDQADDMRALATTVVDAWPTQEEVASLPRLRALTLAVVLQAVFGAAGQKRIPALRRALLELQGPTLSREDRAQAARRAGALVDEEVARRRSGKLSSEGEDVLSLLLDARYDDGSSLSEAEVRDEAMTLVVAGAETTAGSLAWALERLARAPEALARAVEEAAHGGGPYIDAVIYETLRMRPVVPMSARLVKRAFRLGGHSISPGAIVAVSALLIHHRADVYVDPTAFRPDRFLAEPPGTYTWIPFGGGVRRCIGGAFALLEMRVVLSALLSRTTLRPATAPSEGARTEANTMVPAGGGCVMLEARRSAS